MFKVRFNAIKFGIFAKSRRERDCLSMRELATLTEVSAATISRIERGNKPDIETFGQLCEWLEYDPYHFFYVDPERLGEKA